jgi:hypothetical protein
VQTVPPQPTNILYLVELAAESMTEWNALVEHLIIKAPLNGYGTSVTVNTHAVNYRVMDMMDKTAMSTTKGRKFVYQVTYVVEGWLIPDPAPQSMKQILTVETDLELHKTPADLTTATPADAESVITAIAT